MEKATKIDFCFIFHLFVFQKMLSKMLPIDMLLPGCQRPGSFALIQIGGKTPFNLTNQEIRCSVLSWSLHKQLMQYHLLNFHLCQCYPLFYTFFNISILFLIMPCIDFVLFLKGQILREFQNIKKKNIRKRPFPSYLVPLIQREFLRQILLIANIWFAWKWTYRRNSFSYERFRTKTCFDTEAKVTLNR